MNQLKYYEPTFSRGEVCHTAPVIWNREPIAKDGAGWHARFFTKTGAAYTGPFETEKKANWVGGAFKEFSGSIQITIQSTPDKLTGAG